MTKEFFDYQQNLVKIMTERPYLYDNKFIPVDLPTYFGNCRYKEHNIPKIQSSHYLGHYKLDVMDQYKDYFLWFRNVPATEGSGIIQEFVFNLQKDIHIFFSLSSFQEKKEQVFVVKPLIYCYTVAPILDFVKENEKYLVKPEEEKGVGFMFGNKLEKVG